MLARNARKSEPKKSASNGCKEFHWPIENKNVAKKVSKKAVESLQIKVESVQICVAMKGKISENSLKTFLCFIL